MDSKNGYLLRGNRGDSLRKLTVEEYCTIGSIKPKGFYKHYPNKFFDGRNYSQEFLETQKIYFSDPQFFDDPYDCDCFFDDCLLKKEAIAEMARRFGVKPDDNKSKYELLKCIVLCIQNQDPHKICMEQLTECISNQSDLLKETAVGVVSNNKKNKTVSEIVQCLDDQMTPFKNIGVACFTDRNDSIPMWSFYSDSHKGFCVEYEIDRLMSPHLLPVIYSDERISSDDMVKEALYRKGSNFDERTIRKTLMFTILHKSMEWQTQNEWRLVLTPEYLENKNPLKVGRIKKVFLGAKMSEYEQMVITEICRRKGYECYKMELEKSRYALTPKKLF